MSWLIIIHILFQLQIPDFPDLSSPTPYPTYAPAASVTATPNTTPFPTPGAEVDNFISTAQSNMATLPVDIRRMDNVPLLPDMETYETFFGYTKWLLNGTAGQEIFGRYAIFLATFTIMLTISMYALFIAFITFIVILAIRAALFIKDLILDLLPFW